MLDSSEKLKSEELIKRQFKEEYMAHATNRVVVVGKDLTQN